MMEWISLSPYGNTFSKLGYFGCQKLLASELTEVQFIFLRKTMIELSLDPAKQNADRTTRKYVLESNEEQRSVLYLLICMHF